MSMQDPIADMLTRIRNAQKAGHATVAVPTSKLKIEIAKVLQAEGFLESFEAGQGATPVMTITLKYYQGRPVIQLLQRMSRPGLRVYCAYNECPRIFNGMGVVIVSTSKGLKTDKQARREKLGGECLLKVA
jgi:small subunit ribosomal protein S8